jgi:hypothetical protein
MCELGCIRMGMHRHWRVLVPASKFAKQASCSGAIVSIRILKYQLVSSQLSLHHPCHHGPYACVLYLESFFKRVRCGEESSAYSWLPPMTNSNTVIVHVFARRQRQGSGKGQCNVDRIKLFSIQAQIPNGIDANL